LLGQDAPEIMIHMFNRFVKQYKNTLTTALDTNLSVCSLGKFRRLVGSFSTLSQRDGIESRVCPTISKQVYATNLLCVR
jgi:hypothetical protein